jgi:hypothetical protein
MAAVRDPVLHDATLFGGAPLREMVDERCARLASDGSNGFGVGGQEFGAQGIGRDEPVGCVEEDERASLAADTLDHRDVGIAEGVDTGHTAALAVVHAEHDRHAMGLEL